MKKFNFIVLSLILFVSCWLIYPKLPLSLTHYLQIKQGDQLVANLHNYQTQHSTLPDEFDWQTLANLGFEMTDGTNPQYKKISNTHYQLICIKGFDCPYLMYDSDQQQCQVSC